MNIKAILFDLDGVLIDATEWHYQALNRALALFGLTITRYEHLTTYNGLPTRRKLEMLSVEKDLPPGLHRIIRRMKQKYTREEILTNCVPHFDKEFMISELKRSKYKLAVCSNSIRESCELMLNASGIFDQFDLVISNEDVSRPKPDPEMYLKAIDHFAVSPQEVVIVEDAGHGIEAARKAGGNVCEVRGFSDVNIDLVRRFVATIESDTNYLMNEAA